MQKSASRRGCHISETLSLFLTFNKLLCALVPFWPYFYQSQHPGRFTSPPTNHSVPKLPSNSRALSYSAPHPLTTQISAPCLLGGDGASLEVNWWIIASRWNIMDPRQPGSSPGKIAVCRRRSQAEDGVQSTLAGRSLSPASLNCPWQRATSVKWKGVAVGEASLLRGCELRRHFSWAARGAHAALLVPMWGPSVCFPVF